MEPPLSSGIGLGAADPNQHWHLQKYPQAQTQLREQKRARRSAAGCTQKVKDMGTQGTVQALLCLNGMGNWQVPLPGDYLHTSRIQTSGIAFAASLFTLSTRPSLQTSCCFSKWASTDSMSPQLSPPRAISLDMGMVWAVRAAQQTRTRSIRTASAEPPSDFIHFQTYISPGGRKAKKCHEYCKATRNTGAGHKLLSKVGCCSSDRVFHSKLKQAVPPACFLQTRHFALLLGSHPTIQNSLEGETPLRNLSRFPGHPAPGISVSSPAQRVPPGWGMLRGAISPMERHK